MIDENFLHETGIFEGLKPNERKAFLALAKAELDKRVGEVLTGILTSEQIATFEEFMKGGKTGAKQAISWMAEVVPNYQSIVLRILGELKADIINNQEVILA